MQNDIGTMQRFDLVLEEKKRPGEIFSTLFKNLEEAGCVARESTMLLSDFAGFMVSIQNNIRLQVRFSKPYSTLLISPRIDARYS